MKLLYDNSNGKVYHQMVSWIDSSDSDLMSTGILAIGNFARSDAHCINMVESGLSRKLIGTNFFDILYTTKYYFMNVSFPNLVLIKIFLFFYA